MLRKANKAVEVDVRRISFVMILYFFLFFIAVAISDPITVIKVVTHKMENDAK